MSIKLTIHIGQHKTGSKALQAFLSHNRSSLLHRHLYFPEPLNHSTQKAYRISHFEFYVLLKYACLKELGDQRKATVFIKQHQHIQPLPNLEQYLANTLSNATQLGAHQIILSCEDLFDMATAHEIEYDPQLLSTAVKMLTKLSKKLDYKLEIVAFIRRPDESANAHYAQYIKGSDKHYLSFEQFLERFQTRLDVSQIIKIWISELAESKLILIPYEGEVQSSIEKYFITNVLGIRQFKGFTAPVKDLEISNITPNTMYINLIRQMNQRRAQGLAYIPRTKILALAYSKPLTRDTNWLNQKQKDKIHSSYQNNLNQLAKDYLARDKFFIHLASKHKQAVNHEEWREIESTLLQAMVYPSKKSWMEYCLCGIKKLFRPKQ